MARTKPPSKSQVREATGPRAILRVPDVLIALAASRTGNSLAELSAKLDVPKTSLHRLLRTLTRGGYLTLAANVYTIGPAAFDLARRITKATPSTSFSARARPVLEWLAQETHETVMLGVLSERETDIVYIDVIDSSAAVRFSVPIGDRRPFYSAASGKAVLAFMSRQAQRAYVARTDFTRFTAYTTRKVELRRVLKEVEETGVAFDRNGKVIGASAVASPIFDSDDTVFASVSVAGPTERIESNRGSIDPLVREAAERISRLVGNERYPIARQSSIALSCVATR